MNGIIDAIFGFCCFLITEIGLLFGLSYEAINVIAFYYVEPIFTGLMLILALLALCRVPVRKVSSILFWSVVGCAVILFTVGTVLVIREGFNYSSSVEQQIRLVSVKEANPIIIGQYNGAIQWLQTTADNLNTTYHVINIAIYVIALPLLSLLSYIIIRVRKQG
ncbi:MAG: hypothetical protein J5871_04115 [Bacteroidales bacterium]|nr:hypothetical protein [Bacteroidales bacterium]